MTCRATVNRAEREPELCDICRHPEHAGAYCGGEDGDGCECELMRYQRFGP